MSNVRLAQSGIMLRITNDGCAKMQQLIAEIQARQKFIEIDSYTNWLKLQSIPKHKLSYIDLGDADSKNIIICAHGLTRNAMDFGKIARDLSKDYRVIALSYPGRGKSDYFQNKNFYNYQVYMQDTLLFLEKLKISSTTHNIIWLGTSMGGIIGMAMASKYPKIFKALILNDIGPFIQAKNLARIIKYAGQVLSFDNLNDAKLHLKMIYAQFGIDKEEDWDYLTETSFVLDQNNRYIMNYDTGIVDGVEFHDEKIKDVELWSIWKKITCRLLLIHGLKSNILQEETIAAMKKTRNFDLYSIDYAGHAPALMASEQIEYVKNWVDALYI